MTSETLREAGAPALALIEDPEAAQPAHQAMPRGLRLGQELGGEAGFPLQERGVIDAPQHREQETRSQARGVEAERGVEIDDARPAILGDENIVPLAQIDMGDAPGVDLPDELLQSLEHRTGQLP